MCVKLRYDRRALTDIAEIHAFIAQHDVRAATRVAARIRTLAEQLIKRPHIGRATDLPGIYVRSVVRYPYLIFYTIVAREVVILHVRHTARREPQPGEIE